jgi:rRNA maturation protein Rpf1
LIHQDRLPRIDTRADGSEPQVHGQTASLKNFRTTTGFPHVVQAYSFMLIIDTQPYEIFEAIAI